MNLAAGQRIVVARNPAVFQSVHGMGINLASIGYAAANLSNGGERITLIGPFGEILQDFTYQDAAPWPISPDGGGYSLEIINPLGDPENPANWRASAAVGGSPGTGGAPAIPGDYDGNAAVEQADYIVWKTKFGSTVASGTGADGNMDGSIDAADYVIWRKNVGMSPARGTSVLFGVESSNPMPVAMAANSAAPAEQPLNTATRPHVSSMFLEPDSHYTGSRWRWMHYPPTPVQARGGRELLALCNAFLLNLDLPVIQQRFRNAAESTNVDSILDRNLDESAVVGPELHTSRQNSRRIVSNHDVDCAAVDSALEQL
jgi:hypothetical protein